MALQLDTGDIKTIIQMEKLQAVKAKKVTVSIMKLQFPTTQQAFIPLMCFIESQKAHLFGF